MTFPRTAILGSCVTRDAFWSVPDAEMFSLSRTSLPSLLAAAEAGATAVIQPGGSIRDDEVIAAADEAGLTMLFTGMRHFRH